MRREKLNWTTASTSLRRPLGGRLRTYRPDGPRQIRPAEHLDHIRKALLRGELAVNGFNRWRFLKNRTAATHWTFIRPGETEAAVAIERAIAKREAGSVSVTVVTEDSAEETVFRLDAGLEIPDLLLARRDWSQFPNECPSFLRLIRLARQRETVVHIVAAFGRQPNVGDDLHAEARRRWRLQREPLYGPAPRTSRIERKFGESLKAAGFEPIPQVPVGSYYLDFGITGASEGLPIRLDVEVDGRFWHEELPGRQRFRDIQRDSVVRRLGWRPVRLWADEVVDDEDGCIERIRREAISPTPQRGGVEDGRREND